jgi:hypothetical protein
MRSGSWVWVALLAVATSPAQAQVGELSLNDVIKPVERAVFGKETGHDKCKGGGHQNSGGGGHDAGECEEPQPSGPVSGAVCTATPDVESAWRRYSCEVSAQVETYTGEAVRYAEESSASVLDYGDGAADLLKSPPVPQPQVLPDPEAAIAYYGEVDAYVETTATGILNFGDGAADLLKSPPVPQPQVLPDPDANAYVGEVSLYAETTANSIFDFAAGAADLLKSPPTPQPQVEPSPELVTNYLFEVGAYAETTSASVLDYADGAADLLKSPPTPQPQVIPDPTSELPQGF